MAFPNEINPHNKRCEVCCEDVSKYKCPRCSKQTCSVKCVKVHKTSDDCNGQRAKSVFVPISKYTENHLLSDYRFLEDVDRAADNAARNSKKFPQKNRFVQKKFLKRAAGRKGVQLLFLPNVFTKHNLNSSRTFKESPNNIFWCVNWKFPQSDYTEILERKISDNLTFKIVLKKYLHTTESNPIHRQRLKCYISENIDNVNIYMEYDRSIQTNKKYYKLDLHKSIEENLKGKLVIEYPTIHVVLKTDAVKYEEKVLTEDPGTEHTDINKQRVINVSCEKLEEKCGVDYKQKESIQYEEKDENITCGVMENQELLENMEEESVQCEAKGIKEKENGLIENVEEVNVPCKEIKAEENEICELMENQKEGSVPSGLMENWGEEIVQSEAKAIKEESLACGLIENMEEENVQYEAEEIKEEESVASGWIENMEEENVQYETKEIKEEAKEIKEEGSVASGLIENMEEENVQYVAKEIKEEESVASGMIENMEEENVQYEAKEIMVEAKEIKEEDSVASGLIENMEEENVTCGMIEEKGIECEVNEALQHGGQKSQDTEEGMDRSGVNQEEAFLGTVIKMEEHGIKLTQDANSTQINQSKSIELEEGECSDDDDDNPLNTGTW